MKATEVVGRKLKEDVVPRIGKMLQSPVPERFMHSKLFQRVGAQALKALETLSDLAQRAEARRTVAMGAANLSGRFDDIRNELKKVLEPPTPQAVAEKPRKMPEVIKTKGGKRMPAAVAKRAVKNSSNEFKPKKGKKH